jgi:hypothetical protein
MLLHYSLHLSCSRIHLNIGRRSNGIDGEGATALGEILTRLTALTDIVFL